MPITIALAGNPNSGKTTLFNTLTGSNQFVGNWPGVTVEKKEGRLKDSKDVIVTDLPGIYSLSPNTLEEVVARNYLLDTRPDAILNIVDGTNLERNLFLTTQLLELGIPVVVAINMMDAVQKRGNKIDCGQLAKALGCEVVAISALKNTGVAQVAAAAVRAAGGEKPIPPHNFSGTVEHALAHIEEAVLHNLPEQEQRWYAVKLFERDKKIAKKLGLRADKLAHIEQDIQACEKYFDDDSESIIITERYTYIDSIVQGSVAVKNRGALSTSDKIDKIVTNRFLALPIFALVMVVVYYISVSTVGGFVTDWTNDGLFGEGFHLLGNGSAAYAEVDEAYAFEQQKIDRYLTAAEAAGLDTATVRKALQAQAPNTAMMDAFLAQAQAAGVRAQAERLDEDGRAVQTVAVDAAAFSAALSAQEPDPADYGVWVPGVPVVLETFLEAVNCAAWLQSLLLDGIVAGVGAVLGFVPQMLILFLFLAFLEGCGYMARIAFIMDRIFRRFGLSGKSFIPIMIGTGCAVPGIMASRTIENERDRRMTIITTSFIPCSAKLPMIALIAGALFDEAWWVSPLAYFIGVAAIICSGIILKKTKLFQGDVAPFVMELPAYHLPTPGNVLRSTWERGWSFIKKAGTIVLLSTVVIWFASSYGWADGAFGAVEMGDSILAAIGNAVAWIFTPLGWGDWKSAVATITGLVAKENVVSTFGVLFNFSGVAENGVEIWKNLAAYYSPLAAFSFLVFNLLCAPCFAAMGAIRREMNSAKWFFIAVGYQTLFAYVVSLCIYQFGMLLAGSVGIATVCAFLLLAGFLFLLLRPEKKRTALRS